jgi:glycosyltransferase involved in cell wall biosynthesis
LLQIPRLVEDVVTEPAFAIDEMERADLEALATSGWRLQPPSVVAEGPIGYQSFIQASTAELGVAKSGYVASRSGWFSDRSVCYLASGRPVVAQDTGWPAFLPEGDGLRAFRSAEEAAVAVRDVLANPARHARGARALAHDYFDARLVLRRLLDVVGAA